MLSLRGATVLAALVAGNTNARAVEVEVWHGWMNLQECSTVEWRNDGIFDTPSPTVIWFPQELHGRIYATVTTTMGELGNRIKSVVLQCGAAGGVAAGTTALLTGGPGSWEAFSTTFEGCVKQTSIYDYLLSWRMDTQSFCK